MNENQNWYQNEKMFLLSPMKIILFSAIFLLSAQQNNAQMIGCRKSNVIYKTSGEIFRYRQRDIYTPTDYGRTECMDEIRPNAGKNAVVMLTWRRFNIPDDMPSCFHTSITVYIG